MFCCYELTGKTGCEKSAVLSITPSCHQNCWQGCRVMAVFDNYFSVRCGDDNFMTVF